MSSRGGKKACAYSKGKNVCESDTSEELAKAVRDVNLEEANNEGEWEVISRKAKSKMPNNSAKSRGSHNSSAKAWANSDTGGYKQGRGDSGSGKASWDEWSNADTWRNESRGAGRHQISQKSSDNYQLPQSQAIRPPLEHGWNWQSRTGSTVAGSEDGPKEDNDSNFNQHDDYGENDIEEEITEDDMLEEEDDDDELLSDEFDSDTGELSHETRKSNKWFKKFFDILDTLSIDQINEPARQWHCPACQGGPGAIDWYRGLLPLMTHAKTKGSKRMKLHRELAELLDEELRRRGTSVLPSGEMFGKWKGLQLEGKDHEIVWPPMVIIMNTRLEKDENDKWIGMGNQELLDYFSEYAAIRARHSYGPNGHRGMSALIFESSATGYFEAERLHKHFADQRTDRNAWELRRVLFLPGGKRQLYGYMARKEDMDVFNHHSQGKSKLKYDMRSYNEMVVKQIRQMNEDNQQLVWLKDKVVKEKMHSKALKESFGQVSERLRNVMEENRIVRQRTQMHNEQKKEEMDFQEQFFKDQLKLIHDKREAKEEGFETLQKEKRKKMIQLNAVSNDAEDYRSRAQEIEKLIQIQEREMDDFVAERDALVRTFEEKKTEMRRRHLEEEVGLEEEFDSLFDSLMDNYSSHR